MAICYPAGHSAPSRRKHIDVRTQKVPGSLVGDIPVSIPTSQFRAACAVPVRLGLRRAGEEVRLTELRGGVSSLILLAETPRRPACIKRAPARHTHIVHMGFGWHAGQMKVGSIAGSERTVKWNEALRIEDQIGPGSRLAGRSVLPSGAANR